MRLSVTRYLMAVLCMLAAGTWILPVRTLAAPAPAPAAPIDDGDETVALLTLRDAIEAMRLAGEFDRAPFAFNGADLTGDGVAETIEVFPPQRLETPGAMRVVDGATGTERYTLRAPAGEMGFGEFAAVVGDCDNDGLSDIAVWSWLDIAGDTYSALMQVRIRFFAGDTGELIGLLQTIRQIGTSVTLSDFDVVIAADANLDGVLNVSDVVEASAALATDASASPAVDYKMDGALTMQDLSGVVQRVFEEPMQQRVTRYSQSLRNSPIEESIERPGAGVTPSTFGGSVCSWGWNNTPQCWGQLAVLGYDLVKFLRKQALCVGPQAFACAVLNMCLYVSLLNQLLLLVDQCLSNSQCLPSWVPLVMTVLAVLAHICDDGLGGLSEQTRGQLLDAIEKIRQGLF